MLRKAGFGEVNVALDAAEDFVADDGVVAELNDSASFDLKSLLGKALIFVGKKTERGAEGGSIGGGQLENMVFVLDAKTGGGGGAVGIGFDDFIQTGEGGAIGGKA